MTTEDKAEALVNEVIDEGDFSPQLTICRSTATFKALCRAIEQHEAFRQEVSNALHEYFQVDSNKGWGWGTLERFIIPAPKTDPLVDAMDKLEWYNTDALAKYLRDTLDALGFEIKEKNDG